MSSDPLSAGSTPNDFATWTVAAEPALPWASRLFMSSYAENRAEGHEAALEGEIVGAVLRRRFAGLESWEGTATELLAELSDAAEGIGQAEPASGSPWSRPRRP